MFDIIEILFPYLIILYLIDGVTYVGTYHLLLVSHFGKRYKVINSGRYFFNISPISSTIATHNIPYWFTQSGIYLPNTGPYHEQVLYHVENFHFLAYDELANIEIEGKNVKINGETALTFPSTLAAKHYVNLIQELKGLSRLERPAKIRAILNQATNLEDVITLEKSRIQAFFYLKQLSALLFVAVFLLLPISLYAANLEVYLNISNLLLIIVLLYAFIVMVASYLRWELYKIGIGQMMRDILFAILSPITVMQFPAQITKDMYVQFDFLTIAAAFASPSEFRDLLRRELYRISHVKLQKNDPEWVEFWELRTDCLHTLLAQSSTSLAELLAPPIPEDELSASYCPICLSEYRTGFEYCNDCRIALVFFETP